MTISMKKTGISKLMSKVMENDEKNGKQIGDKNMKMCKLISDTGFFEMLYFQGKSAPISITDTIIFENGI